MLYIEEILDQLDDTSTVLDGGCGTGSFDYKNHEIRIVGVDINFPENDQKIDDLKSLGNVSFIRADCMYLPFKPKAFDALIYNNTLEHFSNIESCISEADRTSKTDCYLYVAIPDGSSFDDRLYRFLYKGGGHVNQFTFDSFRKMISDFSDFKLNSFGELYSGFTYLTPPKEAHKHLKNVPLRFFLYLSLNANEILQRTLIWITRTFDKVFRTNIKLYGYILLFSKKEKEIVERKGFINTCRKCGSGFNPMVHHKNIERKIFFFSICVSFLRNSE